MTHSVRQADSISMVRALQIEMAPCLKEGPIAAAAQEFVSAAEELGSSPVASILRAWCVTHLFEQRERVFGLNVPPAPALNQILTTAAQLLRSFRQSAFTDLASQYVFKEEDGVSIQSLEKITGDHYGQLFHSFSPESFWKEALSLLTLRLERNGIALDDVSGKSLVDVGCGGGRYAAAWRNLGASPVLGLDISPKNVETAQRRIQEAQLDRIRFEVADVLSIPLEDNSFDVAFSNGVLHHTWDWKRGVGELLRIMKPGGLGWLYVIEKPGGLYWDSIEILRVVMANEDRETARRALNHLGLPANRIFYMLDHVMVPVNVRLTCEEVECSLQEHGATDIRRLKRGVDFDRIERLYQGEPFAAEKYGVGENRFVFSKN
jgi:ubiquinone/menaquinone biosynthesis C-methylase UbiE